MTERGKRCSLYWSMSSVFPVGEGLCPSRKASLWIKGGGPPKAVEGWNLSGRSRSLSRCATAPFFERAPHARKQRPPFIRRRQRRACTTPCGARKTLRAFAFPCVFRPLRKQRLSFICRWQRRAYITPCGARKNTSGFRFSLCFSTAAETEALLHLPPAAESLCFT